MTFTTKMKLNLIKTCDLTASQEIKLLSQGMKPERIGLRPVSRDGEVLYMYRDDNRHGHIGEYFFATKQGEWIGGRTCKKGYIVYFRAINGLVSRVNERKEALFP